MTISLTPATGSGGGGSSLVSIRDNLGNQAEVGLFGALKTAIPTAQISETFDAPLTTGLDGKFNVIPTGLGTGVSQYNRSLLKVQTGGAGSCIVETKTPLRYKAGSTVEVYFTASWHGVRGAGDIAYVGLFADEDGVYLGYNGTDFVVAYRNTDQGADVQQIIDVSNFNFDKVTRFRIKFGYLGVGNISFEYYNGTSWITLHIFPTDNALDQRTHIGSAILPMRAEVSSASNDHYVVSGSWNSQTFDKENRLQDRPQMHDGERTVSPTVGGAAIVGYRNKTTFGGFPNRVVSTPLFATFGSNSEGMYKIEVHKASAGTFTTGTWLDLKTDDSVLEYNTTLTDAPSGEKVLSVILAVPSAGTGVQSSNLDFEKLGIKLYPGEEFLVSIRELISGSGSDLQAYTFFFNDLR